MFMNKYFFSHYRMSNAGAGVENVVCLMIGINQRSWVETLADIVRRRKSRSVLKCLDDT